MSENNVYLKGLRMNSIVAELFIIAEGEGKENEVEKDGSVKRVRYLDLNISTDERICDGHYYAEAFKKIKRYIFYLYFLYIYCIISITFSCC